MWKRKQGTSLCKHVVGTQLSHERCSATANKFISLHLCASASVYHAHNWKAFFRWSKILGWFCTTSYPPRKIMRNQGAFPCSTVARWLNVNRVHMGKMQRIPCPVPASLSDNYAGMLWSVRTKSAVVCAYVCHTGVTATWKVFELKIFDKTVQCFGLATVLLVLRESSWLHESICFSSVVSSWQSCSICFGPWHVNIASMFNQQPGSTHSACIRNSSVLIGDYYLLWCAERLHSVSKTRLAEMIIWMLAWCT